LNSLPDAINEDEVLWVDAQDPNPDEMKELKEYFDLDETNLHELTDDGLHSKIEEHEDRVFCLLNFPHRESYISDGKMERLALLICHKWIITLHRGYSDITCAVYKKISTHGYFSLSLTPSTDILLYIFLDLVTSEYYPVSDKMFEKLDELSAEASALFRERPKRGERGIGIKLIKMRDQIAALRQSLSPLREIMGRITRGEFALVNSKNLQRFGDLYERTIQLLEVIDDHRGTISDIRDILVNVQTIATNNIIRILTIISAIFLPLNLIAGIYGTNFEPGFFVPGSSNSYGFYIMVAIMATLAITLTLTFRRKGWI
jgi:magnesium transporter